MTSPFAVASPSGLLLEACALLAERVAHRLDTAPPDSIANAPMPAGRRGASATLSGRSRRLAVSMRQIPVWRPGRLGLRRPAGLGRVDEHVRLRRKLLR